MRLKGSFEAVSSGYAALPDSGSVGSSFRKGSRSGQYGEAMVFEVSLQWIEWRENSSTEAADLYK